MFQVKENRFSLRHVLPVCLVILVVGVVGERANAGSIDIFGIWKSQDKPQDGQPAQLAPQQQPAPETQQHAQASSPPPTLRGPKRTLTVGEFTAVGGFTQKYGQWSIGDGLGAMLTTALVKSDLFVVLERARLSKMLNEQELKASGLTKAGTGPKLGQLAGAQLTIYGTVTEFSTGDSGGGLNLGVVRDLGNLPFKLGGGSESSSGKVGMDIRVVDTSTGEVLESHNVSHEVNDSAFNLETSYQGISFGGDQFEKTPLGEAARGAIEKAVAAIAATAAKQPWSGLVVAVDGNDVIINAGQRAGVRAGDLFMVESVGKVFTDPATGQVLGSKREELGMLKLTSVKEKMSFGAFTPLGSAMPKRGDTVVVMKR